MKGEVKR